MTTRYRRPGRRASRSDTLGEFERKSQRDLSTFGTNGDSPLAEESAAAISPQTVDTLRRSMESLRGALWLPRDPQQGAVRATTSLSLRLHPLAFGCEPACIRTNDQLGWHDRKLVRRDEMGQRRPEFEHRRRAVSRWSQSFHFDR